MENNSTNPVQSAGRIFTIMETLAETGPIGLTELSVRLSLHKSTVHRLLTSLISMGYADQDAISGKYLLTYKLVQQADHLRENQDFLPLIHPYIVRLCEECCETVHLVKRTGNRIIYIDKVESNVNSIRMGSQLGLTLPMYCTGVGKAIMATLPDSEIEEIWKSSDIEAKTDFTITDFKALINEINNIRKLGYALDNQENELGVRCIAIALPDSTNQAQYAISVSAPINRMSDERIGTLAVILGNLRSQTKCFVI
ncbi:MAG: Transcriptional regulator KdgR [Firmicutes bacterium ADurb.Bin419]|nr:MAG: Transcriptional regulator KdgR [Firmicutes bacterium ADurb.Bin419]